MRRLTVRPVVVRRVARGQDGIALITVLLVMVVLGVMAAGALQYATGSLNLSRRDQDWNAALAAAEAGLDDYLLRLNRDDAYSDYTTASPPPGQSAFTRFVPVPGASSRGEFRYAVESSPTSRTIKVTSTGKVGKTTRTVNAVLRRRNFLDYLYFTEFETIDPSAYPAGSVTWAEDNCKKTAWEGRSTSCVPIVFANADVVNGPLHTNDQIRIYGSPQFKGRVTTGWDDPAEKFWVAHQPSASPSFLAGPPSYASGIFMPPDNGDLKAYADRTVTPTGCLYTGPTRITLSPTGGSSGGGSMQVQSPFTPPMNGVCTGTVTTLPEVIYVQDVPAGSPYAGCSSHPLGMPITGDVTPYSCRDGDVLVSGTLKGRLTIGAEHNIVITGNLTYDTPPPAGGDVLGLSAKNFVEVYHPVNSEGTNLLSSSAAPTTIQAAILSVQHTFRVQNYDKGAPLPTSLGVTGAISQKFRGAVGTFSSTTGAHLSGYLKNYAYDDRLAYLSPPRFTDPAKSAWELKTWAEVQTPAAHLS